MAEPFFWTISISKLLFLFKHPCILIILIYIFILQARAIMSCRQLFKYWTHLIIIQLKELLNSWTLLIKYTLIGLRCLDQKCYCVYSLPNTKIYIFKISGNSDLHFKYQRFLIHFPLSFLLLWIEKQFQGLLCWLSGKESTCQCRRQVQLLV